MAANAPQYSLADTSYKCIYLIRMIRQWMLQMHELLDEQSLSSATRQALIDRIQHYVKKVEENYIQIEGAMKQCPDKLPGSAKMDNLQLLYDEELEDLNVQTTLENLMNADNWSECKGGSYVNFLSELMRQGARRRGISLEYRSSLIAERAEPPQITFEKSLSIVQHEMAKKKAGIWSKILERTNFGCVVEVKFGNIVVEKQVGNTVDKQEKQAVIIQKLLFVMNNGILDHILWVAPNEEFTYTDDYGTKRLDLFQPSKYVLYQKLTDCANSVILPYANSTFPYAERSWSFNSIYLLLQLFSKYNHIFELKCHVCKKIMKDFIPCTIVDFRNNRGVGFHDNCR